MKRFQIKRITKPKNSVFLAGLIACGILLGCSAQKQGIQVTPPVQISISGTVVSDTGKTISEAKVVAHWTERKVTKSKEVMSSLDGSFVLELPTRPFKLEASKPDYFDAKIEPKADTILTGLKFVLESGAQIHVRIKGIEKEELQFLRVKAIASGKEYLRDDKMYIPVKFDASIRLFVVGDPVKDGATYTIRGVPTGPAEVHVSFKEENLPAQTVEVKGGTGVIVNFEFKLNKVILSGKVTQFGKPLSEWVLIFEPMDGKPAPFSEGVTTASDGSYKHKLNPGTYGIQLGKSSIGKIQGVTTKVWSTMYKTTYTVTKTETLDLEVSTLKKIESKKSAELTQAQGPFVITDRRLLQLSGPDPCRTDAEITVSSSQGYQTRGIVERFGGNFHLWCNGAKHTWIGRHENIQGAIAVINSDKETPLQFRIDKEKGYVYQKGKGTVTMPDGKMIKLPMSVEVTPYAQETSPDRLVSEKFIAEIISSHLGSFGVSPDRKRVAYVAGVGNKLFVVVDGKEEKQYDGIGFPIYSPDSRRVAYMAKVGNKWCVVVDGKEEKQYDGIGPGSLIFSPDSKRVACVSQVGNKSFVVVDGKEEKQYDGIGKDSLIFSPDSKKVAYAAQLGDKQFVVVDGKEEKQYDGIGFFIYSPDSRRVAYMAKVGNKWCVVVDGKEGKQYDGIVKDSPIFSPDSKKVAYAAQLGDKQFVVVDGKEEKQYHGIGPGSLIFSPDSRRVVYMAKVGNKWCVVVDGKEGKQYDDIIGKSGGKAIFFDTAVSLHYLAQKVNSIYLVEENID